MANKNRLDFIGRSLMLGAFITGGGAAIVMGLVMDTPYFLAVAEKCCVVMGVSFCAGIVGALIHSPIEDDGPWWPWW